MKTLDDLREIERVDVSSMRKLLEAFPDQLREADGIGAALKLSREPYSAAGNIVFTGLGGSAIGADVIKDCVRSTIRVPIFVNRNYTLPAFVSKQTLLVVSSYSGNTEETVAAYREGRGRGAHCVTMSSGGEVEKMARSFGDPHIKIPGSYPPRVALGFSVIPCLHLLDKLGFIPFRRSDFDETVRLLESMRPSLAPSQNGRNEAKELALLFFRRYPLFYSASEHFEAAALRWRGQIAENGKALASHHVLPEMNHNEIVGWEEPKDILRNCVAVFLRDKEEHPRVQTRMGITRDLVAKRGAETREVWSRGESLLARIFSLIYLGDFASFYLAVLYGVDPTAVKVIDFLKSELAKVPMP
jgi:glucose/mannose-6-phosphate isomerase